MKRTRLISYLVLIFLVSSALTSLFYSYYTVREVQEVDMYLKVGDIVGLNVDTDAIRFGIIPPLNSGVRNLTITNIRDEPVRVSVVTRGQIASWVEVSETDFLLNSKESKHLGLRATVPHGTAFGNYTGKVVLYFKRS